MIFQSIIKFIPALLYSIVFMGLFYWQFISVYGFIIDHYKESKLFILYGYLFVYLFGVPIVTITVINLLHQYLIKSVAFVAITIITLLIFYGLSFSDFYHIIEFFISHPLPSDSIMGMIFFIVLSIGYSLYSIGILFFRQSIPLSHIVIFLGIGTFYSAGFIHYYCMPLL
ncbi:hypothetical protein GSY74_04960 [Sulfurovum sp. bin170]|uniref:hypothetical protein n=1 Tax=Sulfurovum sp. bin170 TaxID=2695268 RepID=UPI0013DF5F3B|nr:hypothetical protein [Sulfurovum sp. bin170]NEW60626.1 hypothetical protein [Sulfurovum sp. bin170]